MRDEPTRVEYAERVSQAHDDVRGRKILDEVEDAGPHRDTSGGEDEGGS